MFPETLSIIQYNLIDQMLLFTFTTMFCTVIFALMARQQVAPRYKMALGISAIISAAAGYHYFEIRYAFQDAFILIDGLYIANNIPIFDSYRYADWIITVPLLVAQLVFVLNLPARQTDSAVAKLVVGTVLMIACGYIGEIASDIELRMFWGLLAMIPFSYVLYVLWVELTGITRTQSRRVRILFRNTRLLLLLTWGFYPLVYMLPFFNVLLLGIADASMIFSIVQVGYGLADILAKNGYCFMIYSIALAQMAAQPNHDEAGDPRYWTNDGYSGRQRPNPEEMSSGQPSQWGHTQRTWGTHHEKPNSGGTGRSNSSPDPGVSLQNGQEVVLATRIYVRETTSDSERI